MYFRSNYTIEDLLLFSERVYDRMFELHNAAVWPMHVVAIAAGLFVLFVAFNPSERGVRIAFGLLAMAWLFVAGAFFYARYATINWAAVYIVPLFGLMAALLGWFAVRAKPPEVSCNGTFPKVIAGSVLVLSLVAYPLLDVLSGRPWIAAQVFAIAPDPTVVATLGFLALSRGAGVLVAMIIPVLWAAITALTLYALGRPEFIVAPIAAAACLTVYVTGNRRRGSPQGHAG